MGVIEDFDTLPACSCLSFVLGTLTLIHPQIPSCAMKVDVYLPSGDGCSIAVSPETPVRELEAAACQHFERRLKLITKGQQLDLTLTLSEAGLRDGDVMAAVVLLGKLAATYGAFAWHAHGGEVVTWGDPERGGDSSQVQKQLRNVQHPSNCRCFCCHS